MGSHRARGWQEAANSYNREMKAEVISLHLTLVPRFVRTQPAFRQVLWGGGGIWDLGRAKDERSALGSKAFQ